MLQPDIDLARRLEKANADSHAGYVTALRQLYPDCAAAAERIGSGWAIYLGPQFPANAVIGFGLESPFNAAEIERFEAFYRQRDMPSVIQISPLADAALLTALGERAYRISRFISVYSRELTPGDIEVPAGEIAVTKAAPHDGDLWARSAVTNGSGRTSTDIPPDDPGLMLALAAFHRPHATCFFAHAGGEIVGTSALSIDNGVAYFSFAATHPDQRNRGVQSAMLRARLSYAAASACEIATATTIPGNTSMRNVLRAGFQIAYTQVHMSRA